MPHRKEVNGDAGDLAEFVEKRYTDYDFLPQCIWAENNVFERPLYMFSGIRLYCLLEKIPRINRFSEELWSEGTPGFVFQKGTAEMLKYRTWLASVQPPFISGRLQLRGC